MRTLGTRSLYWASGLATELLGSPGASQCGCCKNTALGVSQPAPAYVPLQQGFSVPSSPTRQGPQGSPTGGTSSGFKKTFYKRKLPSPPAIEFSSSEGRQLFQEALLDGGMAGFFKLMEQFNTQDEPAFCGLASLAMVLNALSIDPRRTWKGAWRWFHEAMLDCCRPLDSVKKDGITLYQARGREGRAVGASCLARCNGARVDLRPYDGGTPLERFREEIEEVCRSGEEHIIVSYSRKAFLQTGDGHFSPIGGYHKARDLVLVLDVARFKYPPHWVPLPMLYHAMSYLDPETGRPRGYMRLATNPLLDSVLLTLDVRSAEGAWRRADAFLRTDAPALVQELAAQPGLTGDDVVRRVVDAMPLSSLDFFLVVRTGTAMATAVKAPGGGGGGQAAAAAAACGTTAAGAAPEAGSTAAAAAAAAAVGSAGGSMDGGACPSPEVVRRASEVGAAAAADAAAATAASSAATVAAAAAAAAAPPPPAARKSSCGSGPSGGAKTGCGSGGYGSAPAAASADGGAAAAAAAFSAAGGGCGSGGCSSSSVMAAAADVFTAHDRCIPTAQRQQLLDELRGMPLYGLVAAHLEATAFSRADRPTANGPAGGYLTEKVVMALLMVRPEASPPADAWASPEAGARWAALVLPPGFNVVEAETAYLREQLAHIDEVMQSGTVEGTCGEHSNVLDCAAHGH
ncbi:hypothetical protein HYH03_014405 [Edaphochlamys debaryana]|uniref:glutathione gamma-glutamylcysteinyltransferase n=1 Tax=Edaphochlamys debaryana TaxID=47281 RepID=A0A835XU26_9CHLO|nr:hypothetical protein HYH03_014405 [Edaphochlamys debaryana]|eukprot:KAG2486905.1 hypothetical protein HYH03_014405 [Edaphochlamys debaryana]